MPGPTTAKQRLEGLVLAHHVSVWRSLRRLGVHDNDLEDATQQVFLVAVRRLGDIAEASERPFLLQTALRVAADFRRAGKRRREDERVELVEMPDRATTLDDLDELIDRQHARALLDRILAAMPIELREVFVLFEIEEATMAEIATVLGIPAGTVASRLRRARQTFFDETQRLASQESSKGGEGGC